MHPHTQITTTPKLLKKHYQPQATNQEGNARHTGGHGPATWVEDKSRHGTRRHGGELGLLCGQEDNLTSLRCVCGGVWSKSDVPSDRVVFAIDVAVDDAVQTGDADVHLQQHLRLHTESSQLTGAAVTATTTTTSTNDNLMLILQLPPLFQVQLMI